MHVCSEKSSREQKQESASAASFQPLLWILMRERQTIVGQVLFVCLLVCWWLVCFAVESAAAPSVSHFNEVPAAVPSCPRFCKKDQTTRFKNRFGENTKSVAVLMVLVQLNGPVFTERSVKIPSGSALVLTPPARCLCSVCVSQVFMSRHFLYNCSQPILDVKIAFCQVCVPYR